MRCINNNVLEVYGENSELIFSMEETFENEVFSIKLYGEMRNEVAYEFEDELVAALLCCKKVELDFENVDYVASMVLKILLSSQHMVDELEDTSMCICRTSDIVLTELKKAGFLDILDIKII